MLVRRAAVITAVATLTSLLGWSPANATVKNVGLFGAQDPTYDGVYRQSLSLLALRAAGVTPDGAAVTWLSNQRCSDNTYTSYRSNTLTACAATAKDSNATGLAATALTGAVAQKVTLALKFFQDSDGGFYSNKLFSSSPGSDANSTGIALTAFAAAGIDPTTVTSGGKDGADFLQSVQLTCSAAVADRGAYDFQVESPLVANDYATAQAALGALGAALPVAHHAGTATQPAMTCPGGPTSAVESAQDAAGYLARRIQASGGLIPAAFGGGSDYTSTATAVTSLVAAGVGADQVTLALNALASHVNDYVRDSNGDDRPAALAWLILAAHAGGRDPRSFGGSNLVARLQATEISAPRAPKPPVGAPTGNKTSSATPTPSASPTVAGAHASRTALPATGGHSDALLALIGAAVFVIGGAATLAGRRR